jgi:hypothetical protein
MHGVILFLIAGGIFLLLFLANYRDSKSVLHGFPDDAGADFNWRSDHMVFERVEQSEQKALSGNGIACPSERKIKENTKRKSWRSVCAETR